MVDGVAREVRPLLVAFANARQYGNGALIAPRARIDDGRLDVVVVDDRSLPGIIRRVPALFRGKLADVPGVTMVTAVAAEVTAPGAIRYHVDGEPCESSGTLRARRGHRRFSSCVDRIGQRVPAGPAASVGRERSQKGLHPRSGAK